MAAPRTMEEELNYSWSRDLKKLPVFKDLPRLAGRITVQGQFSKVPNHPAKDSIHSPSELSVREFLTSAAKRMGFVDLKSVEPFIIALEKDWYFFVDSSLALITPEKWKEYGIPDRLVQEMLLASEKVKKKTEEMEKKSVIGRTISTFRLSSSIGEEGVDLNQLEQEDKLQDVEVGLEKDENKKAEDNNKRLLREVAKVVLEIAARLETEEKQMLIKKKFESLLTQDKFGDLELVIEDIFDSAIGADSKTAKVLKAIHQNIIFIAVFQVKSKIPMTAMARDVNTREGWRIYVQFSNNIVTVSHRRREQSLAPETEQYWFEWDLRMTFDKDLQGMQSSVLKITDLGFGDKTSDKKREEISKALSSGSLIVS